MKEIYVRATQKIKTYRKVQKGFFTPGSPSQVIHRFLFFPLIFLLSTS